MSLPDTFFIFVLALIIFGPKKLPEIGRQLGRLVGEFRRASNEFKYQIEEELRLVELSDRPSKPSIAASLSDTAGSDTASSENAPGYSEPTDLETYPQDSEENVPAGQYPNPDYLKTEAFKSSAAEYNSTASDDAAPFSDSAVPASIALDAAVSQGTGATDASAPQEFVPTITPAAGSEPRTTAPYAARVDPFENLGGDSAGDATGVSGAAYEKFPFSQHALPDADRPAFEDLPVLESPAPAGRQPAPTEAEATHG